MSKVWFIGSVFLCQLGACNWFGDSAVPSSPSVTQRAAAPKVHTKQMQSETYLIDGMYKSMRGPAGIQDFYLRDGDPELLWIVGYETEVVNAEGGGEMSQEFMCHANLDFDAAEYYKLFPTSVPLSGRVFTLSQGQQHIEFPTGFGIPVASHMPLSLATQVLNLNRDNPEVRVQHKVTVKYVRDSELDTPMIPLFQGAVEGFKALDEARYYGVPEASVDPALHGAGCGVGSPAIDGMTDDDEYGQRFTAHWVVPPGREVNVTNVTRFLNLPFDTEAHYIAVHLHPFAESLTLRDLTLGQDVFSAATKNSPDKIGLDAVEYYASEEGIKLYKDHQYELVSVYDNPLDEEVDSMAVMYLYLHDKQFTKPVFSTNL